MKSKLKSLKAEWKVARVIDNNQDVDYQKRDCSLREEKATKSCQKCHFQTKVSKERGCFPQKTRGKVP